ncbi:UPF0228 family protein [Methanosarcina sp. DH2]|uniref:UPF0228 family protein n=1 Tax=Methanosarcina sp. DH2 TaxID=2605639 RepID=UPI001E4BA3DB|nr:UPF0228 family protein [Methanosarcina sp. DH2]
MSGSIKISVVKSFASLKNRSKNLKDRMYMGNIYYVKVDENKRDELSKEENWNEPNNWIPERDVVRMKNDIEMNEKVLIISPDYIDE